MPCAVDVVKIKVKVIFEFIKTSKFHNFCTIGPNKARAPLLAKGY